MREKIERVRMLLFRYHLSYVWLISELEKQDVTVYATELSDIMAFRRRGKKSVMVIDKSIEILERYGRCYAET